jgi:c-di-GMP-binding flagellar brake protein YcgR
LEVHEYGRYQASLEIEWGSARLRTLTRDISAGGMFVEAEDVLWVGAAFRARLITEKPCWLECSVKRVEPGQDEAFRESFQRGAHTARPGAENSATRQIVFRFSSADGIASNNVCLVF